MHAEICYHSIQIHVFLAHDPFYGVGRWGDWQHAYGDRLDSINDKKRKNFKKGGMDW